MVPVGIFKSRHEEAAANPATCSGRYSSSIHYVVVLYTAIAMDGILVMTVPKTFFSDANLPVSLKTGLLLAEFSALAVIVSLLSAFLFVLVPRLPIVRKWPEIHHYVLCPATIFGFIMLFFTSWLTFFATGRFLGRDSLGFFVDNSLQLIQHASHMMPAWIFALPIAAVGYTACALFLFKCMKRKNAVRAVHLKTATFLIAAFVTGALILRPGISDLNTPVVDARVGTIYTVSDLYHESMAEKSGPASHVLLDCFDRVLESSNDSTSAPEMHVSYHPIIPMGEYLAGLDAARVKPMNVVIILVESLRPDQLKRFGGTREVMPALEALSREGRCFTKAFSQSSHSNYADLCPLSSHYPLRSAKTHVYPEKPAYPRTLIYDILKHRGYRTAIFSSQNEKWGGMYHYLNTGSIDHFLHSETYDGPVYVPRGDTGFFRYIKGSKRSGKIDDRFTIGEAIKWIDSHDPRPFFAYVNLQNSHVPYERPADFPAKYGPEKVDFEISFGHFPADKVDVVKNVYSDSLAYVDLQIQRLFDHLKNRGLWKKTIIVVTSDTGQAFFEHGFAAHANKLYNELLKVPLIIYAPSLEPGVDHRPAQHIDIPPTLLGILGMKVHPSFQGIDLLDAQADRTRTLYAVAQCPLAHQYAVIRSDFKLIYDARSTRYSLFDLRSDPEERNDILSSNTEIVKDLSERLTAWKKLQIDYYKDVKIHTKYYPPVMKE